MVYFRTSDPFLKLIPFLTVFFIALEINWAGAQPVSSDHWAATDALGRKVREYKEIGRAHV